MSQFQALPSLVKPSVRPRTSCAFAFSTTALLVAGCQPSQQERKQIWGKGKKIYATWEDHPPQALKKGELVLSFYPPDLIDYAARGSQATNDMEIKSFGWAFGQIADVDVWRAEGNIDLCKLQGAPFAVVSAARIDSLRRLTIGQWRRGRQRVTTPTPLAKSKCQALRGRLCTN